MNKTGYIYDPFYLKHDTGSHPENPGRVSHYETPDLMARLTKERQNLSYAEIPGADHPYTGKAKELWDAVRGWYKGL